MPTIVVLVSGGFALVGATTGATLTSAWLTSALGVGVSVSNTSIALSGLVSLVGGYINKNFILINVSYDTVRANLEDINDLGMLYGLQGLFATAVNYLGDKYNEWKQKTNNNERNDMNGNGNNNGIQMENSKSPGNPVVTENLGSTGRIDPRDIQEQMA